MTRRVLWCGWALGLVLLLGPSNAAAQDPNIGDVVLRRHMDIPGTVQWLADEADRIEAGQVLLVFDAATFAPPPGLTEYTNRYAFFDDLPAWLDALAPWAARFEGSIRATSSLAPATHDLKENGWRERVDALVRRPWWDMAEVRQLEPALNWMKRLLVRSESAMRACGARGPRMVVLVSGEITPERWLPVGGGDGHQSAWRTKLLPIGKYWDDAKVAAYVRKKSGRLYVVAPEVRFGDFEPIKELPDLPWASRPQVPFPYGQRVRDLVDGLSSRGRRPDREQSLRDRLEKMFEDVYPDPEERRRHVEEMLERIRNRTPTLPPGSGEGGEGPRRPVIVPSHTSSQRFCSTTPIWFDLVGDRYLQTNHAPSGYGYWPFVRACAATSGKYVFYPFPASPWLDRCPADHALLNRLAPEPIPLSRYVKRRKGDFALDAICKAMDELVEVTPWGDALPIHRAASGWSALRRASPLRMQSDWFLRQRPFDYALWGSEHGIERLGEHLKREALPAYDEALRDLDAALAKIAAGKGGTCHPRSIAHLRLTRFWTSMSAFHLEALAHYALEIDRHVPEAMQGHVDNLFVTYVPTIRLSDCLEAYDGRVLSEEDEAKYGPCIRTDSPCYQGNILDIPGDDPNFRARRSIDSVLRNLDPRLKERARDMIEAARGVMATYARTGWGWTTYYSEAYTFIFHPVEVPKGHRPTPGGTQQPERPTTPRGPSSDGGGSTPGGPTTGG